MESCDLMEVTDLAQQIKWAGNGHINHQFFWESLAPTTMGGGQEPQIASELGMAIDEAFGSFENMMVDFSATTNGQMNGSEWGWLAYNKETRRL